MLARLSGLGTAIVMVFAVVLSLGAAGAEDTGAAAAGPIEMVYSNWYTGESGELEQPIVDWWNADNPDATVTSLRVNWGDYREKLFTMIAGGDPPDVAAIDTWWSQEFFARGACVPLQPLVDRDNLDVGIFRDGFLDEGVSALDGELYGLPWGPGRNLLFYQDELFRDAGLREPYNGWTTEEWRSAGQKLTQDSNGDGVIDMWGTTRYASVLSIAIHGADYVTRDGQQSVTDPKFIEALQFILDNTEVYGMQPTAAQQSGIVSGGQPYNTGAFATWHRYDGHVGQSIKSGLPDKTSYRVSYEPKAPGQPTTTLQKGNTMCIMSGSDHQDMAWEFMKHYFSSQPQALLAEIGLYPSTLEAEALDGYRHPPAYPVIDLEPAINPGRIYRIPFDVAGFTEALNDVIDPAIAAVLLGEETPEAGMAAIADDVDRILKETRESR